MRFSDCLPQKSNAAFVNFVVSLKGMLFFLSVRTQLKLTTFQVFILFTNQEARFLIYCIFPDLCLRVPKPCPVLSRSSLGFLTSIFAFQNYGIFGWINRRGYCDNKVAKNKQCRVHVNVSFCFSYLRHLFRTRHTHKMVPNMTWYFYHTELSSNKLKAALNEAMGTSACKETKISWNVVQIFIWMKTINS